MMRRILVLSIMILAASLLLSAIPAFAAETDNPRLIISSYSINGGASDTVTSGRFTLYYTLLNTSTVNIVNAIMTHDQRYSYIMPIQGSSNVEYIGRVNPGRDYHGALELYVPEDAPSGFCQLDVILNYNVGDPGVHSHLSVASTIYIRISNNPELFVKRIELSDEISGGDRRYLYIEYENPGTGDFKNLQLIVEGDIDEQQRTQSLPILKGGRSNSIEYPIQFTGAGIQEVDVYISYEDDAGNTFKTPVVTQQAIIASTWTPDSGSPSSQPQQGYLTGLLSNVRRNLRNPAFLATLVIAFIAAVAIAMMVVRIRRQAIKKNWYYKNSDDKNKR